VLQGCQCARSSAEGAIDSPSYRQIVGHYPSAQTPTSTAKKVYKNGAGAIGVTGPDVRGFVTVMGAIGTLACFIWTHIQHKAALATATVCYAS